MKKIYDAASYYTECDSKTIFKIENIPIILVEHMMANTSIYDKNYKVRSTLEESIPAAKYYVLGGSNIIKIWHNANMIVTISDLNINFCTYIYHLSAIADKYDILLSGGEYKFND